jgi:hypothetical protein
VFGTCRSSLRTARDIFEWEGVNVPKLLDEIDRLQQKLTGLDERERLLLKMFAKSA